MTARPGASLTTGRADPVLDALVEELTNRLQAGEVVDVDDYARKYPDHVETLRRVLPTLEVLVALGQSTTPHGGTEVAPGPAKAGALDVLGDFRIVREVGRGGMGVVYEAVQVSLGRRVALKVLPFASAMDPRQRQRFQVEAQAAAHLQHANVVPVFAVGSDRGVDFYAMSFIEGRSLADVIRDLRAMAGRAGAGPSPGALAAFAPSDPTPTGDPSGPSDSDTTGSNVRGRAFFNAAARLGVQAADALEHAHGLGVLHRDIKPANLLVDAHGHLWVTDFGLARFHREGELTLTGDLLGTLRYMSPEQALAKPGAIDHRADVYSLGATLYELLTLRPAFDGRDRQELLRQITLEEPRAPRRINPSIPRDLETIVRKAMAKEPDGRYASAGELADDLRRYLADEPIRARRPGLLAHTAKWARRHRRPLAAAAAALVVAAVAAAVLLWRAKGETEKALDNVRAANLALREARERERKVLDLVFDASDRMTIDAMTTVSAYGSVPGFEPEQFYRTALRFYERLVEQSSRDPSLGLMEARGRQRVAFALMVLKDPKADEAFRQALSSYEALAAKTPTDARVLTGMSETLQTQSLLMMFTGRMDTAKSAYRRALMLQREIVARDPENDQTLRAAAEMHQQVGIILESVGLGAESAQVRSEFFDAYAKALERLPDPARRRRRLATVRDLMGTGMAKMGRRDDAAQLFREAAEADASDPAPRIHLARLLAGPPDRKPHDPARAVALASRAVALSPQGGEPWGTLGMARYRAGDWKGAAEALAKATAASDGGEPLDALFLSMARWRLGDRPEARRRFDAARARLEAKKSQDTDVPGVLTEARALLEVDKPKPPPQDPAGKSGTRSP
jgi:serine/threonine-protein kinase